MKGLALRGLADDLHGWLRDRADRSGRSLNSEILWILEEARGSERRAAGRIARLEAFRAKYVPDGGFGYLDEAIAEVRRHRDDR